MASLDADPVYLHRLAYWVERGGRGGGPPTRLTAAAWEAWGRRLAREGKEAPPPNPEAKPRGQSQKRSRSLSQVSPPFTTTPEVCHPEDARRTGRPTDLWWRNIAAELEVHGGGRERMEAGSRGVQVW